jgi:hypothetical protein
MKNILKLKRDPFDRYYTPHALAWSLVDLLPMQRDATALEPSLGGGAFLYYMDKAAPDGNVWGVDLDSDAAGFLQMPEFNPSTHCVDFLDYKPTHRPEWIIGNPPFSKAEAHARHALSMSTRHVGFLLRIGFMASATRVPFWTKHPCRKVWPIAQRPRDWVASYDYAFYWWDKDYEGPTVLGAPVVWR